MGGMSTALRPIDLHTEYRQNPLGLDRPAPRLGWGLDGGGRHAVQGAWQVQVGSASGLADAWDSGRVTGDAQIALTYAGPPLAERTRYHWRVRVWDGAGNAGPWSDPAWFETAFFDSARFAGAWLSSSPAQPDERIALNAARWTRPAAAHGRELSCYGVRFTIPAGAQITKAYLHTLADGHDAPWSIGVNKYLSVNGVRPDSCDHLPRCCVMAWDLAQWLKPGDNHVALKTFHYGDSAFLGLLEIQFADGTALRIPTGDPAWCVRGVAIAANQGPWDDAKAEDWGPTIDAGACGAGPWPADDRRNAADCLLPALILRRSLHIAKPVTRARIYATALGTYELTLAGRPVGDRVLAPGWTDYRKRVHYQTYDVTGMLPPGEIELSATVGDGWWSGHLAPPFGAGWYGAQKALKLALHLDYADGTSAVLSTADDGWQAATGPVRLADLMQGQIIDLTRAPGPWRTPIATGAPAGALQAQPEEPVGKLLELPARTLTQKGPGRIVVDFGQNLVGAVRLRLRAPAGTRLVVRHSEVLDLAGEPWTENLRSALAVDEFVCSGGDDEFLPTFTFHGFRYAEIRGLPGGLTMDQISAVVFGSDTADRGTFTCSDPLLNRLQANIRWGQRGNFLSIPTDCPQRDERLGWTADTQVFVRTAVHNADCAAFYAKYVDDLLDAQHPETGGFPDYAPTNAYVDKGHFGWADAGVVIPWWQWRLYGDLGTVRTAWAGMRRYLDQRDRTAVDDLNLDWSFGDWVSPAPQTPNDVLGPIYHAWMHRLMAEMAQALGKADEQAHHHGRFERIKAAWRAKHLDASGRCTTSDTQASYACAVRAGLMDGAEAARHLVRGVERHGWHLNTGFLGTYCLLPALSQGGHDDVAWRVLGSETFPGWLYTVKNGATTMWERWNTYSPETGPVNVGNMNSYNHYAFGAVGEWMYSAIGGLDRTADDVGFQKLLFRPVPGGHCRHASCSYRSLRGTMTSRWWIDGERFNLHVAVPANCTAEVHVPSVLGAQAVTTDGARFLRSSATHVIYAVGAGTWTFVAPA